MGGGWLLPVLNLLGMGGGAATATTAPTTVGGTFRRAAGLSRTFRRRAALSRIFARSAAVSRVFRRRVSMGQILRDSLPKDSDETVVYLFDFSKFDEAKAGETVDSATVPTVAGITIGTPAVITEETNFIPADQGVRVSISGGTVGSTYDVECRGTFSGGSIRVVKGRLAVE